VPERHEHENRLLGFAKNIVGVLLKFLIPMRKPLQIFL